MAVSVTFNGSTYLVPTTGETGWDTAVTGLLVDIGANATTNTATQTLTNKVFQAQAGTAVAPSFAFTSDAGSGMYSPALHQLGLSTSGAVRLSIDAGGTITVANALLVPTQAVDNASTNAASTAFVLNQAAAASPLMNGTVAVGTSNRYARADHVHASDTTKAAVTSPTINTQLTISNAGSVELILNSTTAATNQKYSDIITYGTGMAYRFVNDAFSSATDYITLTRSGFTCTGMTLTASGINLVTSALSWNSAAIATQAYVGSQDTAYYAAAQAYANSQDTAYWALSNSTFVPYTGGTMSGGLQINGLLNLQGNSAASATGAFIIAGGPGSGTWSFPISQVCANGIEATGFLTYSDSRGKSDIRDINTQEAEDYVMLARPRHFILDGKPTGGFIAQEEVDNGRGESVGQFPSPDPRFAESDGIARDGHRLSKDYINDIAYLTKALQSALERIAVLEAK